MVKIRKANEKKLFNALSFYRKVSNAFWTPENCGQKSLFRAEKHELDPLFLNLVTYDAYKVCEACIENEYFRTVLDHEVKVSVQTVNASHEFQTRNSASSICLDI